MEHPGLQLEPELESEWEGSSPYGYGFLPRMWEGNSRFSADLSQLWSGPDPARPDCFSQRQTYSSRLSPVLLFRCFWSPSLLRRQNRLGSRATADHWRLGRMDAGGPDHPGLRRIHGWRRKQDDSLDLMELPATGCWLLACVFWRGLHRNPAELHPDWLHIAKLVARS